MMNFIFGLIIGGFVGVFMMCMCNIASDADDDMENMSIKKNSDSNDK